MPIAPHNPARKRAEEFLRLALDGFYAEPEAFIAAAMDMQRQAVEPLLKQIADIRPCSRCQQPIAWVTHKNGKKAPYTNWGHTHFADCPNADEFRKEK